MLPLVVAILCSIPSAAFAYIDPGAGNALLSIILVIAGSAAFLVKSIWFRAIKFFTKTAKAEVNLSNRALDGRYKHEIVLFSEGRLYHQTFEPIVREFIQKKKKVFYVTLDLYDPLLTLHDPFFDAQYLGAGNVGFARFEQLSAKLMIATTPNIGTEGFPIKRPKNVQLLVHVCHAVSGVANYRKYSLDSYDVVLMSGPFMLDEIRSLERLRNLKTKKCVSVGLPYLDDLLSKADAQPSVQINSKHTILIAPSWGKKNFLKITGTVFIAELQRAGYSIIIRPHPYSMIHEPEYFKSLQDELSSFSDLRFDFEVDGSKSLACAQLLISGRSAVRFDFAFVYKKPVVSVRIPEPEDHEFESADLDMNWDDYAEQKIGPVVHDNFNESIPAAVRAALALDLREVEIFKREVLPQFGSAKQNVFENCIALINSGMTHATNH
jgi:hypothetical protein